MIRHVNQLVIARLGGHHDSANLLDLCIIGGGDSVDVPGDLISQIGDTDKFFEEILGHDVGVPLLAGIIGMDVDVVDT